MININNSIDFVYIFYIISLLAIDKKRFKN